MLSKREILKHKIRQAVAKMPWNEDQVSEMPCKGVAGAKMPWGKDQVPGMPCKDMARAKMPKSVPYGWRMLLSEMHPYPCISIT